MDLRPYISAGRIIELTSADKEEALRRLCEVVAPDIQPQTDPEDILIQVLLRERAASTGIGHGIALPHARIDMEQDCLIAIGRHTTGVQFHSADGETVHIIALVVVSDSKPNLHLQILSQLASTLSRPSLRSELMSTRTPREITTLLSPPSADTGTSTGEITAQWRITTELIAHAESLASALLIDRVLVYVDPLDDLSLLNLFDAERRLILVSSQEFEPPELIPRVVGVMNMPWPRLSMDNQVDLGLMLASQRNLIHDSEPVICLTADPHQNALIGIMVGHFQESARAGLPISAITAMSSIHHDVMERIITLAVELSQEGREGKPVGTIFVVGDWAELRSYCSQLVINPFKGYEEAERNILDPRLEETIKEFAALDGAFIVRGDGVVESAGTYLTPKSGGENLPSGLGARHRAAAAITQHIRAIAITVSESTGSVSIFQGGELLVTIERGQPATPEGSGGLKPFRPWTAKPT